MNAPRMPVGARVVAVLFMLLALNALNELFAMVAGEDDGPVELAVLQGMVGLSGAATAVGAWTGARWAPVLAIVYGTIAAGMVVALGPLLDMPAEERGGLLFGAGIVLVFSLACAWYLRRSQRRSDADVPTTPA